MSDGSALTLLYLIKKKGMSTLLVSYDKLKCNVLISHFYEKVSSFIFYFT